MTESDTSNKWTDLGKAAVQAAETINRGIADFFAAWNENNKKENN